MFTGIITHIGKLVKSHSLNDKEMKLTFSHQFEDLVLGESIAVNGACLTVCSFDDEIFSAVLSQETIQKTSFKKNAPREHSES